MNETNATSTGSTSFIFPPTLIAFITLQQIIFVVACLGNGLVVYIFVKYLKFQSNTNKFIVSLAFADFFTGLSTGSQMFYFFYPRMSSNMAACLLRNQVIEYMTMTSQLTVFVAAFDRYLAICHPHKYSNIFTKTSSNITCILLWVLPSYAVFGSMSEWINWHPGIGCSSELILPRALFGMASIVVYSFSIITTILYYLMLKTAWRFHRRIRSVENNDQIQIKTMTKSIRQAKLTGIITIVFSVCWLPYMAFRFRGLVLSKTKTKLESDIANWLVFLGIFNSVANPIVYSWKRPDFNHQCRKILCGRR